MTAPHRKPSSLSALAAIALAVLAQSSDANAVGANFHPAATEAEMALDAIIRNSERDDSYVDFAIKAPWRNKGKDHQYGQNVSKGLQSAWAKAETLSVQKNCKGKYLDGELCGLGFNPVSCAQDASGEAYLYQTEAKGAQIAIISYRWPRSGDIVATYKMIRQGDGWILDGVSCHPTPSFNMKK
ncbi:conserved exported hypothetical protein [Rhodospirillaceae bacterium LM-1]|nr:conserved exported hypothetical protein [Rhodospirillaceae bacterium LM-1]